MEEFKIILFDEDKLTQTMVESYLQELTFYCSVEKYNEFNSSILNNDNSFKLVIININTSNCGLIDVIAKLPKNKYTKYLIISNDKSTDIQVKALRAGCEDFLSKPLVKSDFIYFVQTIYNKYCKGYNRKCETIGAVSFESGTGKTFFLINLGKELSKIDRTLLVDINEKPNITNYLKYVYFTEKKYVEGIQISRYKETNMFFAVRGQLFDSELAELKKQFKYILIDGDNASKYADKIFAVITPENTIGTISDKYKNLLQTNKNISLIINKFDKRYTNFIENFQNKTGLEALMKIPGSVYTTELAKNSGVTISEINSELDVSKCYTKLAQIISNGK